LAAARSRGVTWRGNKGRIEGLKQAENAAAIFSRVTSKRDVRNRGLADQQKKEHSVRGREKMSRWLPCVLGALVGALFLGVMAMNPCYGQDKPKDMGGWQKGSAYNKLYIASERDRIKGKVVDITEVVPLPGMSPGVALLVKDPSGDVITVHLGPRWYIDPKAMGIKKNDKVKVKGVWAEINEEDIFIASKVKKGEYFQFKVRLTKDGTPLWTMSEEEQARARSD